MTSTPVILDRLVDGATSLRTRVVEKPWQAIGGAFLIGAWAALELPHLPRNRVARAAFAMIGAVTLRAARGLVLAELVAVARRSWATTSSSHD